jgi:hypothetical protein
MLQKLDKSLNVKTFGVVATTEQMLKKNDFS